MDDSVILHHYDASPFTQKAQKMLGIKGLSWHSVEMPMIAPKPDIEALTGGYRGTPVLQVGADVYVDNQLIPAALDGRFPDRPHLIDPGHPLFADAVGMWSERFFEPVLHAAITTYSDDWDDEFLRDRQRVFPHLDFGALRDGERVWASRILAFATTLNAQLSGGARFLQGDQPGALDAHCWSVFWFIRNALPDVSEVLTGLDALPVWEGRVNAIGIGDRSEAGFDAAWETLAGAVPRGLPATAEREPLADWIGAPVSVSAVGADRGTARGELLALTSREMIIGVEPPGRTRAQVHFPRLGYELALAS